MKVLQINAVSSYGSTGRATKELADYLNENGHIGIVAYSEGTNYPNSYQIGTKLEKNFHAIYSRLLGLQGYFSRKGTKNLIKYIQREKPDVVRIGNLHSNFINIPMLLDFLGKNDIATILTLDDCFLFTGKCTHYTLEGCYKWKTGCNKCPRINKDNPSLFLDNTRKMWNDKKYFYKRIPRLAVVGVSDWITSEARKSILATSKYIKTIYNWIDLERFKPIDVSDLRKSMNLENKFIILGVASDWSNLKGLDKFIQISKLIKEDEYIILVGRMEDNVELPKNIIHIEQTNNIEELVKYYCMADVFLQLSLEETFGKVTAEALSCGTPVVVYNSTANPELVGEGCGYISDKNSIEEVIKYMQIIKENTKQNYTYSCRSFSLRNFDKDKKIKEYINLCEQLINSKDEE